MLKERCIGVFDLASAELDAFSRQDIQVLTPLANMMAVAIENARLYEAVAANEHRLEKEVRFAQRVQRRCCRRSCRSGCAASTWRRGSRRRASSAAISRLPHARPNGLVVALGDVSGKGAPAALYSAFAGELVRGRTYRRRYTSVQSVAGGRPRVDEQHPARAPARGVYCTLCYASFDFKRRLVTMANSGLPYPIRCTAAGCARIDLPGVPLGSFPGTTYDEATFSLAAGDVFVICSDGISEAMNEDGEEFTPHASSTSSNGLAAAARRRSSTRSSRPWKRSAARPSRTTT